MKAKKWPLVQLGEVLKVRREVPDHNDLILGKMKIVSKISFESGVIELRQDGNTKTSMIQIMPGDLVLSGINAAKGAIAIYDCNNKDPIAATIHYSSYSVKANKVDTKFLWWYFRSNTFREILEIELPNGIKTELKASRLLALSIPLPPLAEQQRIVARIEALSSQIARAKQLQQEIATEAEGLCLSLISKDREATQVPMSELLELKRPDVEVRPDEIYQFAGVYSFGRGVFKGVKRLGMEFSYTHLSTLKTNDFVYPKLMAWEGAMAIVPPEYDGYVVSTEFPVFRVKENRVLPETLATYFKNPAIWPKISGVSTGTNVRRRRLNPKEFLRYNFTLPSMQTQVQLREIRVKVACIINDQLGLVRNLESLMPSILAKAFKGEL